MNTRQRFQIRIETRLQQLHTLQQHYPEHRPPNLTFCRSVCRSFGAELAQRATIPKSPTQCNTVIGTKASVFSHINDSVPLAPPVETTSILNVSTGDGRVLRFILTRPKSLLRS